MTHGKVNCISVLLITVVLCRLDSNRQQLVTVSCKLATPIKIPLACHV